LLLFGVHSLFLLSKAHPVQGLINIGNTCFLNAIAQAASSLTNFTE